MMSPRSILLIVLMGAGLSGCVQRRVVHDPWANLRRLADPTPASPNRRNEALKSAGYAVLLKRLEGSERRARAEDLMHRLRSAGLGRAWARQEKEGITLYLGRFADSDGLPAERALARARQFTFGAGRPFSRAALVPLGEKRGDLTDPLNLKRHVGRFSLQIAVYDAGYRGGNYRKAAEQQAHRLREQGNEAYYYHGPHHSMVTLGLFTWDDFVQQGKQSTYGPAIRQLQKRFPYNLHNGKPTPKKKKGKVVGKRESFLVRVF